MLRYRLLCWVCLLFVLAIPLHAQDAERLQALQDSLQHTTLADSTILALTSDVLALTSPSDSLYGFMLLRRGDVLFRLGQSDAAVSVLEQAADVFATTSDVNRRVTTYTLLGRLHQQRGSIAEGVTWLEQALPILSETSLSTQGDLLNVLATQYAITGDNTTAGRYFEQARTTYSEAGNPDGETNVILNLGLLAEQAGDFEAANAYLLEADSLAARLNDAALQLRVAVNLGSSYIDQGRYDEALPLLANAATIAASSGDVWNQCFIAIKQGRALHGMGRYREALPYLQEGNRLALMLESLSFRGETVQLLKDTYARVGQFEDAYRFSLAYDSLTEAYFTEENQRILQELEAEQKAAQITTLEQQQTVDQAQIRQQRILIGGVIVVALLLAWLVVLYIRRNREQTEQAEQLLTLDRAKSRFFANISHELRTPLTLILSPLERALQNTGDGASPQHTDLALARKNGQQLLHLVEDILDLSKLDAGELTLSPTSVTLAPLLRRIFFSFESLAQQRRVTLQDALDVDATLAAAIDVRKVEQILNNLLSNAIKYTPAKGTVTLTASQADGTLTLVVQDTGRGIHPDDVDHVFDRYYQSGQAQAPVEGGTGIGLALTQRLVDLMEGSITVASTHDEGSTFTVTLPLVFTEAPAVSAASLETATAAPHTSASFTPAFVQAGKQARILLVEDHRDMSAYLADLLEPYYDVTRAFDGQEALDSLRTQSFDLITSDIMMPRMDGLTFLDTLKQHDSWRHIPFILLTARTDEADKLEGWRLGVDDYITKPFNADELLARIDNLLRNQQEREAWHDAHDAEPEPLSAEQAFLQHAEQIVLNHLDQSTFTVPNLAQQLSISERNLHRKTKALTGLTPLQFMREIRLQRAYRLLERKAFGTVAEVCYAVGFENPSYFARIFAKRFGQAPSQIIGRA